MNKTVETIDQLAEKINQETDPKKLASLVKSLALKAIDEVHEEGGSAVDKLTALPIEDEGVKATIIMLTVALAIKNLEEAANFDPPQEQ